MSRIEDADKQRRAEEMGAPPNTFFGVPRGIASHHTAEVLGSNSNPLLYSHADMVRLCDEAKRDQRHACAEAITKCSRDVSEQCIWFDDAHQAIMNAAI